MAALDVLSLTQAKEHLNIPASDGQHDNELTRFIEAVVPAVERRINVKLYPRAAVAQVAARGGLLVLPDAPVASLTSITRVVGAYVDAATAVLDVATGTVRLPLHVTGIYDVEYLAGFADVPAECRLAVAIVVGEMWSRTQRRPAGARGSGAQQELEVVARGIFPSAALQLLPERTPVLS